MKRNVLRIFSLLLGLLLLFPGCRQDRVHENTEDNIGENWSGWPQLNFGVMQSEKLKTHIFSSKRMEMVSRNGMAETKEGYYINHQGVLYYADKNDLSNWLRVCNEPNCMHIGPACNASINNFVIQNDRIYFADAVGLHQDVYMTKKQGFAIYSKALNGTDLRLEYVNEDMLYTTDNASAIISKLTDEHWLYYTAVLNTDGTYNLKLFRTTKDGTEALVDARVEDYRPNSMLSMEMEMSSILGDVGFNHLLLGDTPYMECRYKDGELYYTDLSTHYEDGRYLSANLLRCYRMNDGYYDVNLETGEEVRIGAAYLKDGGCAMPLPNCIIETSLFIYEKQPESGMHTMAILTEKAGGR